MTPQQLIARVSQGPLLLDGGLGSLFISMGLQPGEPPERWVIEKPDRVVAAHRMYVEAGSDVVHTASFGATPIKLATSGLAGSCDRVNRTAVKLAREAVEGRALVAGDIGPTGKFFPPTGDATDELLFESYRRQVAVLAEAGVDLLSIETMYDLRETLCAVRAAVQTGLGVLASMTFEPRKRGTFTFMGDPLGRSLESLASAGATAVGFNCSVTADVMVGLVGEARRALPDAILVAQPNAGQPITTPKGVVYNADPEAFASDVEKMLDAGASIVGGCCGTDERFVRAARARMDARAQVRG